MQGNYRRSPTDRRPRNTWSINVRLSELQRLEILRDAAAEGISISDLARSRIFGSSEARRAASDDSDGA